MPNGWRTINSLVHKIRLHGRRGKGMTESFSRQKSRHAPQKEGGLKILCDIPPVRPTNLMSRMDGKKKHTQYKGLSPCRFTSPMLTLLKSSEYYYSILLTETAPNILYFLYRTCQLHTNSRRGKKRGAHFLVHGDLQRQYPLLELP